MVIFFKKERTSFFPVSFGEVHRAVWRLTEKTKTSWVRGTSGKQSQFWWYIYIYFFFTNGIKDIKHGWKAAFWFCAGWFFWTMEIHVEARVCHCRTTLWWAAGQSCAAPEVGQLVCKGHRLTREAQSCTTSLWDDESSPLQPAGFSGFLFVPLFSGHRSTPPEGLVHCVDSHLEDTRCCWCTLRSSFTGRILKPASNHNLLQV